MLVRFAGRLRRRAACFSLHADRIGLIRIRRQRASASHLRYPGMTRFLSIPVSPFSLLTMEKNSLKFTLFCALIAREDFINGRKDFENRAGQPGR